MKDIPSFLDFEASSLGSASFPIEVAWNLSDGSIESHLISPKGIDKWRDWSFKSQELHGISREELIVNGKPPSWICHRMNECLSGKVVYTEDPDYDGTWLSELFSVSRIDKPEFELRNVDDPLESILSLIISDRTQSLAKMKELKAKARQLVPRKHRAVWDVEYLVELWRIVNQTQTREIL